MAAGAMLVANAERLARIGWLRTQTIKARSNRSGLAFHFVPRAALFILRFNLRSRPEVRILDFSRLVLALALWHMRRHACNVGLRSLLSEFLELRRLPHRLGCLFSQIFFDRLEHLSAMTAGREEISGFLLGVPLHGLNPNDLPRLISRRPLHQQNHLSLAESGRCSG